MRPWVQQVPSPQKHLFCDDTAGQRTNRAVELTRVVREAHVHQGGGGW